MKPLTDATRQFLMPIRKSPRDRVFLSLRGDNFFMRLFSQGIDGQMALPSANTANFPLRIPERKQSNTGRNCWNVAATDTTVAVIDASFGDGSVTFEDELTRSTYEFYKLSWTAQEMVMEGVAKYHADGTLPKHDLTMNRHLPLEPYQQVACWASMLAGSYCLFMEQGTGKTATVIARIDTECARRETPLRVLVVCPKNVRTNWVNELSRFSVHKHKAAVLRGDLLKRTKTLVCTLTPTGGARFTVCVVAYEAAVGMIDTLKSVKWDLVVVDESHYIKTHSTKRTRAIWELRDCARSRMILTGTPITNSPLDLYAQLEFLGRGYSGFNTWKAFKKFYGVTVETEDGHEMFVDVQNMPIMQERMARRAFVVRKEDALPYLPPKRYSIEEVEMTKRQTDIYKKLRTQLMVEIEDAMNSDRAAAVVINNVLTKLLRLAQVTSGFLPVQDVIEADGTVTEWHVEVFSPNPKLERLVEMMRDKGPDEKTIIWACFRHDLFSIHDALLDAGLDGVMFYGDTKDAEREEAIRRYNHDVDCKYFVSNPAAGGTGTNLIGYPPGREDEFTTNTTQMVYYSQNWSAVQRSQSEDRSHRRGTRERLLVTDLCVPGTIDEEIRARVTKYMSTAYQISDVRAIVRGILTGAIE